MHWTHLLALLAAASARPQPHRWTRARLDVRGGASDAVATPTSLNKVQLARSASVPGISRPIPGVKAPSAIQFATTTAFGGAIVAGSTPRARFCSRDSHGR